MAHQHERVRARMAMAILVIGPLGMAGCMAAPARVGRPTAERMTQAGGNAVPLTSGDCTAFGCEP